jgi:hypothetical protein
VSGTCRAREGSLDFVVDGESVYERHGADLISPLGWLPEDADEQAAARLLRRAPPDAGDRVSLYVCPECADLACGAITALIDRRGRDIVWTGLAFTTIGQTAGSWHHDEKAFGDIRELCFNAREYWAAITGRPRIETP